MTRPFLRPALAALLFAMLGPASGRGVAAESAVVASAHDQASLVADAEGWAPGRPLGVGLRLRLAPGWHTYWSNPGDAGEAPTVAVTASGGGGGQTDAIVFPTPQRLPEGPLMSFAYTGDVLLPLRLVPAAAAGGDPTAPLRLVARAEWLACATVCVPEQATLTLTLPPGAAVPSPQAGLFAAARAATPRPSPFAARIGRDGGFTLAGAGLSPTSVAGAWLFPDRPGLIDQAAPQVASVRPGLVTIPLRPAGGFEPGRPFDALVVLRDPSGQQTALTVSAAPADALAVPTPAAALAALAPAPPRVAAVPAARPGLARMLLLALAGGLVLNLMPCVFPVLAMKAMALGRLSGMARREQRLSAAFYTAGILLAFAALGGLLLGLRAAGSSVGWGFQFQSLAFVAGTSWLLFLVGLNLVGAFEIGGGFAGLGQGLASRTGHVGDFATGLLAVLVATPCTAPFMGIAIAGALAAPAWIGLSVFLAMGLGLALPYLLFACIPGLIALLPRPGLWMEVLKQAMAFPIFAACAWLAWVASIEGGADAVQAVLAGLVLLGTGAWLFGLSQRLAMAAGSGGLLRRGRFAGFLSLACLLATLALLRGLVPMSAGAASREPGWEAFSETSLDSLRRSGRPVLVDMSAAWCISCLVNERVALGAGAVRSGLAAQHVALLKGDWTLHDDRITRFLRAHGRDGVPFYIYYPAGRDGEIWPQILTPDLVLRSIGAKAS